MIKASVFAFVLLVASVASAQTSVIGSVWPLQSDGRIICTATSINQDKHYWLTAAHCVQPEDRDETGNSKAVRLGWLGLFGKKDKPADKPTTVQSAVLSILGEPVTIVVEDDEADIAVLSTPRAIVPALKLAEHAAGQGEAVQVVGFPLGLSMPVLTRGIVSAPLETVSENERPYTLFGVTGAPGNSGSAITNDKGEVISVLQVGWSYSFGPMAGGAPFDVLSKFREYFGQ